MKNDHLEGFHQLLFCSFKLQEVKKNFKSILILRSNDMFSYDGMLNGF